eukprot:scaffold90712_cov63-Phaeocystis_antarctica.AAC.4
MGGRSRSRDAGRRPYARNDACRSAGERSTGREEGRLETGLTRLATLLVRALGRCGAATVATGATPVADRPEGLDHGVVVVGVSGVDAERPPAAHKMRVVQCVLGWGLECGACREGGAGERD